MSWTGKICLVTGGARGVGRAIARALAQAGAIVQVGDVDVPTAATEAERAEFGAGSIEFVRCDVTDDDSVRAWTEGAFRRFGKIDVLVNNAGLVRWDDVLRLPVEDARRMMRVAFDGMVLCTQAVLPRMLAAGAGRIVNMGSIAGDVFVFGGCAAYAASKAAVNAYTRVLQAELAGSPVRVTLVCPGPVRGTRFDEDVTTRRLLPSVAERFPKVGLDDLAAGVLRALSAGSEEVVMPWQYFFARGTYRLFPGLSRRLCRRKDAVAQA
jgi:NAD(P)-dependent dehydrogenase (short-subunit alcohol dehydrogenase family)